MSTAHSFLFALPGAKTTYSTRKVHLRRLYDILQLSIQKNDVLRARRAWAILARCRDVPWMEMWTTAVHLLSDDQDEGDSRQLEFMRAVMLQYSDARECILKELVLRLISSGRYRDALDELELYLPSVRYQDDPLLHLYAGLTSLFLAQSPATQEERDDQTHKNSFDPSLVRCARVYFERAKYLDPDSKVAQFYLEKMADFPEGSRWDEDSDDGNPGVSDPAQNRKRARM